MGLSRSTTVNVGSPPMGTVKNIADLVSRIQDFQKQKNIASGEWIDAYGYDQDQLEEKDILIKKILMPHFQIIL